MGLSLNYLEGQSPLTAEEEEELKIKTISTKEELDEFEQYNIETAMEWLIGRSFSLDDILSEKFIKDLHYQMFGQVWFWAGKFRRTNKNIGVDKTLIAVELKKLFADCFYWVNNQTFNEEEIAIRWKHRLVSIHPFPNGNGRHARLAADIMMEKVFKKPVFTWGGMGLNKPGLIRASYIKAIREADQGNYEPLLRFAQS
jgi:Fic-DOC domain mobile mystery protein B